MTIIEKPKAHTLRRFDDLSIPSPGDVSALAETHEAIVAGGPLFKDRVFSPDQVTNIFVSGHNNRKIGRVVTRGEWTGMPIYMLTLPERTTCPTACHMYRSCYGNAMHLAKRIAPGAVLEKRIATDIDFLADKHPRGFVIRLHVLGDFYSVKYVQLWARLLKNYKNLHVYGYTARGLKDAGEEDLAIANALAGIKGGEFSNRFRVRWSRPNSERPFPGAAIVLDEAPATKPKEGIICPAETESTACCSTCGLCWESKTQQVPIFFLKHGLGSSTKSKTIGKINESAEDGLRKVAPIEAFARFATTPKGKPPLLLWVDPEEIWIETAYQRDLSKRSTDQIRKIVEGFDWGALAPPRCVEVAGKLCAFDGQHTAIASASHPEIDQIPILKYDATSLEHRAELFVLSNWSKVAPSQLQKFRALVVAKNPAELEVQRIANEAGVQILASPPSNGQFSPGDTLSLKTIRILSRMYGAPATIETLRLMVRARLAPLHADVMKATAMLMHAAEYRGRISAAAIEKTVSRHLYGDIVSEAKEMSRDMQIAIANAMAIIFYRFALKE